MCRARSLLRVPLRRREELGTCTRGMGSTQCTLSLTALSLCHRQVARETKATATNVTAFASQIDEKYKVSEQASILAKAAKERGEVMQKNTAAAFANMNTMAKSWSSKVAENPNVRSSQCRLWQPHTSICGRRLGSHSISLPVGRAVCFLWQVATTAEAMRGWSNKLGASFKSLQDSVTTKLDIPAYAPQQAPSAAAKEGAMHADAAAPALPAPEAAGRGGQTAAQSPDAVVKPENAFSLGE